MSYADEIKKLTTDPGARRLGEIADSLLARLNSCCPEGPDARAKPSMDELMLVLRAEVQKAMAGVAEPAPGSAPESVEASAQPKDSSAAAAEQPPANASVQAPPQPKDSPAAAVEPPADSSAKASAQPKIATAAKPQETAKPRAKRK